MPRTRIKPPMCMGQRMQGGPELWRLLLPDSITIKAWPAILATCPTHWWEVLDSGHMVRNGATNGGPQAAANAAERWLVRRAELTLKLAGRRAV
jgi:hypothetical protein